MFKVIKVIFHAFVFCVVFSCNLSRVFSQQDISEQLPAPPPISNVQFINATSVDLVDLSVKGLRDYPELVQAARISGGVFPITDWSLKLKPSGSTDSKIEVVSDFKMNPTSSATVVLLGDFALIKESNGKEKLRAAIVNVSNDFLPAQSPNRLTIINGCPTDLVRVVVPGQQAQNIEPFAQFTWVALPASLTAEISINGKNIALPMEFVSPFKSVVVALFNRGKNPDFVLMPQTSLRN